MKLMFLTCIVAPPLVLLSYRRTCAALICASICYVAIWAWIVGLYPLSLLWITAVLYAGLCISEEAENRERGKVIRAIRRQNALHMANLRRQAKSTGHDIRGFQIPTDLDEYLDQAAEVEAKNEEIERGLK